MKRDGQLDGKREKVSWEERVRERDKERKSEKVKERKRERERVLLGRDLGTMTSTIWRWSVTSADRADLLHHPLNTHCNSTI